MHTSLRVLAPPAAEPVSIDTLRKHLRLDQDFEDDLLQVYLASARTLAEGFLNRVLINQTLQWFLMCHSDEGWPMGGWGGPLFALPSHHAIELPRPPAQSIVSLSILDSVGDTTAIAPTNAPTAAGGNTLQFASPGFPAAVSAGFFVTDLTAAAVPIGATVASVTTVTNTTTVTLSAPLSGNVGKGDGLVFSSLAPVLPLPAQPSPSPAPSLYLADLSLEPARLRLDWPILNELQTLVKPIQHIEVDFVAGYGSDGTTVPPPIINAILLLAAFLYERRGDDGGEMPEFVKSLLWNHRVPVFGGG